MVRASLLYRLLDLFSKPVFHFIRFGHLQIQNSMPTSTLRAFLVPRSSDPPVPGLCSAVWARAWRWGPGRAGQGRPWMGSGERGWALAC